MLEFLPLATGESFTPKYKINRTTNFTTGDTVSTVGKTQARVQINSNFGEIEFGFNGASSSGTFPQLTAIYFAFDDLVNERNFRL